MTVTELRDIAALTATILGILGALIGFWKFRAEILKSRTEREREEKARQERELAEHQAQLRLDEVTHWTKESVEAVSQLVVLMSDYPLPDGQRDQRIADLGIKISGLIEVGRLYFQNVRFAEYNAHKEAAYRGLRPLVLDQLIAAFQACERWPNAQPDVRPLLCRAVRLAENRFLSLMQIEVGRSLTRDPQTAEPGVAQPLERILNELSYDADQSKPTR